MHLSHPPGHSVNDGIPVKEFSLKYISVDTVMDAAMMLRRGAIMAKVDVKAALMGDGSRVAGQALRLNKVFSGKSSTQLS